MLDVFKPVPTIRRLLDVDGSLLASAGKDGKVVAAIFANIWSTFQDNSSLEYILCELEVSVPVCFPSREPSLWLEAVSQPSLCLTEAKIENFE